MDPQKKDDQSTSDTDSPADPQGTKLPKPRKERRSTSADVEASKKEGSKLSEEADMPAGED